MSMATTRVAPYDFARAQARRPMAPTPKTMPAVVGGGPEEDVEDREGECAFVAFADMFDLQVSSTPCR